MFRIMLILSPTFLLAAETDILPRTVNFIIFAVLMYYWTAKHFKNLYKSRIELISNRLGSIEQQLNEAKKNKDDAIKKIEKANKDADEMVSLAKIQAKSLSESIKRDAELEVENLIKYYSDQKLFEERRAKLEIIDELVDEMINSNLNLSQDELLNIVSKRIS